MGHGWLNGVILLHRSPVWLCRVMAKLCRSCNTRVLVVTRKGTETSEPIRFSKGVHEKVSLSFHREKEYIRIQCFTQGFCHLNLSGITKFKYAHKNMNYGFWWWSKMSGVIWYYHSNGQFTLISILARSVKTTGFETVFKKLRSNKKRPNSQRIVQTCLNHFHGRKLLSPFARPAVYLAGDSRMRWNLLSSDTCQNFLHFSTFNF